MRVLRVPIPTVGLILVWAATTLPSFGQQASLSATQEVAVVSDGQSGVYLWNFGTSDFRWEEHTGNYSFLWDIGIGQWTGLYLYDYQAAAWPEALYSYRQHWPQIAVVSVPAGSFTMGNSGRGDDAVLPPYGFTDDEMPTHTVTLSEYQIGKYEVTNAEFCEVLNWGLGMSYVQGDRGAAYTGGDVYSNGERLLQLIDTDCPIEYSGGRFSWEMRAGSGGTLYSMMDHPVIEVTWYGAVAFCAWLSVMEGLTPAYAGAWELVDADTGTPGIQFEEGYRLPTEAEWERAAAWDGSKHWIYGFVSDTLRGRARCNYNTHVGSGLDTLVNPLGLSSFPFTSPVGWFSGANVSPNGNVQTVDSPSPVGCYDMCGNVSEWCSDRYDGDYYDGGAMTDPTGPASGSGRVLRGGDWIDPAIVGRSAGRDWNSHGYSSGVLGFRVARTPSGP
jgi:formylglycine-generating enzyme required for sulfatase activity